MDSFPVQSSSKCSSSDFSIKKILGDSQSSEEEFPDPPSWLCYTRYQPPRLPRSSNVSGTRARRSGRHARVPFTGAQAAALEAAYARAPYLAPPALRALAAALQLRDDRIKIWFQNRRARERREKNGNVTPPKAVTLQPTAGLRVSEQQDLSQLWNRITYPLTSSNPMNCAISNINNVSHTFVSNSVTIPPTYHTSLCNRPFSEPTDTISDSDKSRCESPLDIETID